VTGKSLEDNELLTKAKPDCNLRGYHTVEKEPEMGDDWMACNNCGFYFTKDLSKVLDNLKYKIEPILKKVC